MSDKFEHSDKGVKYFIGYKDDKIIRPLCIILPQMSWYIKSFDNGGKPSFMIKDDSVLIKYKRSLEQNLKKIKHKISQHVCIWRKIHKVKGK